MRRLSTSIFFSLALSFATNSLAHEVRPDRLEIFFVGTTATFTVSDPSGCSARLTAVVNDPTIASVSPGEVPSAVRQTFTVTALKGGQTTINVGWNGIGSACTDTGSTIVRVTVVSGPDLTITQLYEGMFLAGPYRVGAWMLRTFEIQNIGDGPTTAPITVIVTVPDSFRVIEPQRTCPGTVSVTGSTFRCDVSGTLPAGEKLPFSRTPFVVLEPQETGSFVTSAQVQGGGDINLSNNMANVAPAEVNHSRTCKCFPYTPPKKTDGRLRGF